MPSFTIGVANLQASGPIIEALQVTIGDPVEKFFREHNTPIPSPINITAMIDTGASVTVIQEGIPTRLGLQPVGVTTISTPSSANVPCNEYLVRLVFPNNLVVHDAVIIEAPLQGQHIQCLIGRDILAQGVFVYIGHANQFTVSF